MIRTNYEMMVMNNMSRYTASELKEKRREKRK